MPIEPPTDLQALTAAMQAFVESKGWLAGDSPKPQTPAPT